jgi:hypothetical protein
VSFGTCRHLVVAVVIAAAAAAAAAVGCGGGGFVLVVDSCRCCGECGCLPTNRRAATEDCNPETGEFSFFGIRHSAYILLGLPTIVLIHAVQC